MYGMSNNMGFFIHGFPIGFLCSGGTVKLYFSVPTELYTVFSALKTLAKHPDQKAGEKSNQNLVKILPTSG